jgi:hypothetical protein
MDKKLINIENDLNQIKFILERLVSSKYKFIVDIKIYDDVVSGYFFVRVAYLVPEKHITLTNLNNIISETRLLYNMMGFDYDVFISLKVS